MAARPEPLSPGNDDPRTAADALSLHTIADQADAYAAQEQEDADFALALALEEEESERFAAQRQQQQEAPPAENVEAQAPAQTEAFPPYRDDPDAAEEDLPPPYRDDPDVEPVPIEGDPSTDPEAAAGPNPPRQHIILRIIRKIVKAWLCYLMVSTVFTIVLIIGVLILVFVFGKKVDTKDAAWRASGSKDYSLKLTKLYPALEPVASDECKTVWEREADNLPCHRMILSSQWDDGIVRHNDDYSPFHWSGAVCTDRCGSAIMQLGKTVPQKCYKRTDRFDINHYGNKGKGYFDQRNIEEGPAYVQKALTERYMKLCRPAPRVNRKSQGTCASDLWLKWGVVDGKNEANLEGVDSFLQKTSKKKTLRSDWRRLTETTSTGAVEEKRVLIPGYQVGPGDGETDCGICVVDWLQSKMLSFDYGQILKPGYREHISLMEFNNKMTTALRRCKGYDARHAIRRAHNKWTELGWWCNGKPCSAEPKMEKVALDILHGIDLNEIPSNATEIMKKRGATQAMLDLAYGVWNLPCGTLAQQTDPLDAVFPHEHIVQRLCSDQCRNAVDRLEARLNETYPDTSNDHKYTEAFKQWRFANDYTEKLCKSTARSPSTPFPHPSMFCAPGYTSMGMAQWLYYPLPPRARILAEFSKAIDELADSRTRTMSDFSEAFEVNSKKAAETVCNQCAGEVFIGKDMAWKDTVDEYLADDTVDGKEYVRVAKKGWRTCAKLMGMDLGYAKEKALWRKTGLDRFD